MGRFSGLLFRSTGSMRLAAAALVALQVYGSGKFLVEAEEALTFSRSECTR